MDISNVEVIQTDEGRWRLRDKLSGVRGTLWYSEDDQKFYGDVLEAPKEWFYSYEGVDEGSVKEAFLECIEKYKHPDY